MSPRTVSKPRSMRVAGVRAGGRGGQLLLVTLKSSQLRSILPSAFRSRGTKRFGKELCLWWVAGRITGWRDCVAWINGRTFRQARCKRAAAQCRGAGMEAHLVYRVAPPSASQQGIQLSQNCLRLPKGANESAERCSLQAILLQAITSEAWDTI